MAAGQTALQTNPNQKVLLGRNRTPHKILISSIKTHRCHTGGICKQNLKSTDKSKAPDSEEIIKLNHFTGFQGVLATQGCSLPDSSYSLPSSRSFNTTRMWGKNSLGLRKPHMSILCLAWPRPYSNRMLGKSSLSRESGKDSWAQTCTNTIHNSTHISLIKRKTDLKKLLKSPKIFKTISSYLYCENAIDKISSLVVAAIFSAGNKISQIFCNKTGSSGDTEKQMHNIK